MHGAGTFDGAPGGPTDFAEARRLLGLATEQGHADALNLSLDEHPRRSGPPAATQRQYRVVSNGPQRAI